MGDEKLKNIDEKVVKGFGEEWDSFNQSSLDEKEAKDLFNRYFNICLLYTSDAADDSLRVDLGGRRIIKKL